MRLEIASHKAMKYACIKFHYSKKMPMHNIGFSVFNSKNEWCGVIMYGRGVSPSIAKPYKLNQGEVIELQRMAMNGKQKNTSKALSISLKLIKKHIPLAKLVISFADNNQEHIGVIYQATNWIYTNKIKSADEFVCKKNGKSIHSRMVNKTGKFNNTDLAIGKRYTYDEVERIKKEKPKYKYIYPLTKDMIPLCKSLSKPYPKNAQEV